MSRAKKPRKAYRPRPILLDPLALLRPAAPKDADPLMLQFLGALESVAKGSEPTVDDWRVLSDAINTVETLATMGKLIRSEVQPTIDAASTAMCQAIERRNAGHAIRFDALGLESVRDVVDVYRQALDGLTEHEMHCAQVATERRVREILRRVGTSASPQVVAA